MPASMTSPSSVSGDEPLNANPPVWVLDALGQQFQYIDIKYEKKPDGKLKKTPYHQSYKVNYNDFVFKPERVVERMDAKNKRPYVGLDTCIIGQIDIDILDGVDEDALKWLYDNCPYFLSVSKRLPHFIVRFDEQHWYKGVDENGKPKLKGTVSKVTIDKETAADFLHGIWTYMKTDEVLQNAHLLDQIPTINLKEWKVKLTKKSAAIANMCLPPTDASPAIQPLVCIPFQEKKIHSKAPDISKLIAALKKEHVDADEGRTFKSMAWALKSHSGDAHKDELREAGRLSTYCQSDYESWFERLWQFDTNGETLKPITISSFHYYCKQLLGKEYPNIREEVSTANFVAAVAEQPEEPKPDPFIEIETDLYDGVKELTNAMAGRIFKATHTDTYVYSHKQWYRLNAGGIYEQLQDDADVILMQKCAKSISEFIGKQVLKHSSNSDRLKILADGLKMSQRNQFMKNSIDMLRMLFIDESLHDKLDKKLNLIGFTNGVYDLELGLFRKAKQEDYVSRTTGYDYVDKNEEEYFDKLIDSIFEDEKRAKWFKVHLGSLILGGNREEKVYFWVGKGRNGKGTIDQLVRFALGAY